MSSQDPLVEPEHVLDAPDSGQRAIRGSGMRIAGFGVSLLIGIISAPLMIRHLTVAEYGIFATANSLLFVVTGLAEGGIGNVAVREYTQSDASARQRLLGALLGLRYVMMAVGALVAVALTFVLDYPIEATIGVAIGSVGLLIGATQNTSAIPLAVNLQLAQLTAIDLVRQIAATATIAALVVLGASLIPFFGVFVMGLAAMLIATLIVARPPRVPRPMIDRAQWSHLMRQTGVFAVATAFAIIYFQVALLAVAALSNAEEAGYYGAAFRVVEVLNGVPWLLAASVFPIIARAASSDTERLRYALRRMTTTAVLVGAGFAVVLVVGAPWILAFVGGGKLDPSIPILRTIALGVPFTFVIATWSFGLLSMKAHRAILIANGLALVAAIVLAVALLPRYGATGAGVLTLVVEVVLAAAYAVALARRPERIGIASDGLWKIVLAAGAGIAAGLIVPIPPVAATLLAGTVFAAIALVTRAVPQEILDAARRRTPQASGSVD
jgi:O-antigen/teichoic acid export membrane protein